MHALFLWSLPTKPKHMTCHQGQTKQCQTSNGQTKHQTCNFQLSPWDLNVSLICWAWIPTVAKISLNLFKKNDALDISKLSKPLKTNFWMSQGTGWMVGGVRSKVKICKRSFRQFQVDVDAWPVSRNKKWIFPESSVFGETMWNYVFCFGIESCHNDETVGTFCVCVQGPHEFAHVYCGCPFTSRVRSPQPKEQIQKQPRWTSGATSSKKQKSCI